MADEPPFNSACVPGDAVKAERPSLANEPPIVSRLRDAERAVLDAAVTYIAFDRIDAEPLAAAVLDYMKVRDQT